MYCIYFIGTESETSTETLIQNFLPIWAVVHGQSIQDNVQYILIHVMYTSIVGLNIFYSEEKDKARHTTRQCPMP